MNALMQRLRDEDGVSAVIVVISLVALLGGSMLSVDAGSVWKTRRALVTDTDAAALAAARYLDANGTQACLSARTSGSSSAAGQEANYIVTQNDPKARLVDFSVFPYEGTCSNDAGHVRVGARMQANLTFAPVFGIKEVDAYSSSAAQYGPLATAIGMRPLALCDKSPHFLEWALHQRGDDLTWGAGPGHPSYGDAVVHRIYFQRGTSGCGTAAGNWDWLDFNETLNPSGNSALSDWLTNGYPGVVSLGDAATGIPRDCNPESNGQQACAPKTGAGGGSFEGSLEYLRDNKIAFPIIVYDKVVDVRDPNGCETSPPWTADGQNARFCPVAFLLIRIHAWSRVTGQLTDDSYFDLEFVDEWWVGQIGGNPSGGRPTAHGIQLCGTNYGTTTDTKCDV